MSDNCTILRNFPGPFLNRCDLLKSQQKNAAIYLTNIPVNNAAGTVAVDSIVTLDKPVDSTSEKFEARLLRCRQWEWIVSADSTAEDLYANVTSDSEGNLYVAFAVLTDVSPNLYDAGNVLNEDIPPVLAASGRYMYVGRVSHTGKWLWRAYVDNLIGGSLDNDTNLNYLVSDSKCNLIMFPSVSLSTYDGTINYYDINEVVTPLANPSPIGLWTPIARLNKDGLWDRFSYYVIYRTSDTNPTQNMSLVSAAIDSDNATYSVAQTLKDDMTLELYDADGNTRINTTFGVVAERALRHISKLRSSGYWAWTMRIEGYGTGIYYNNSQHSAVACSGSNLYVVASFDDNSGAPEFYNSDNTLALTGRSAGTTLSGVLACANSEVGEWSWAVSIDGMQNNSHSVVCDSIGDVYMSGVVLDGDQVLFYDRDNSVLPVMSTAAVSGDHVFVAKISADGYWLWFVLAEMDADPSADAWVKYDHNLAIDAHDQLYLRVNANTASDLDFTDRENVVSLTVVGNATSAQHVTASLSTDGRWTASKCVILGVADPVAGMATRVDGSGNVYSAGNTSGLPQLKDRDGTVRISGRSPTLNQVYVGKCTDEILTATPLAIVHGFIEANTVILQYDGKAVYNAQTLVPGCKYYLEWGVGTDLSISLTAEEFTSDKVKRRYVGTACSRNVLVWKPE